MYKRQDATSNKNVDENQKVVHTFSADEGVVWHIVGGLDQSKFDIHTASGAITFKNAPDFENPTDSDGNNSYEFIIRASDMVKIPNDNTKISGITSTQKVTINVQNLDEIKPIITGPSGVSGASSSSKSIKENIKDVHKFTANENVTWSLNGGADVSKFNIDSSGHLKINAATE